MEIKYPSNRSFALVMSIFFSLLTCLTENGNWSKTFHLSMASFFMMAYFFFPEKLFFLNKTWVKLGLLLQKITSPFFMVIIYFLVLTPLALILRVLKQDILKLKFSKNLTSYWQTVDRSEQEKKSMLNQF